MIKFTVTEDHLKLIRRLQFDNESSWGAPSIDHKRPYGNSDVFRDIADIVGIPQPNRERDKDFTKEQYSRMRTLNLGVVVALQIFVATGRMLAGEYVASNEYTKDWKLIDV